MEENKFLARLGIAVGIAWAVILTACALSVAAEANAKADENAEAIKKLRRSNEGKLDDESIAIIADEVQDVLEDKMYFSEVPDLKDKIKDLDKDMKKIKEVVVYTYEKVNDMEKAKERSEKPMWYKGA
jgi:hypothetical protein